MAEQTIYRLPDVKTVTGLSRSTIYAEIENGSFPASISLTDNGRAVGWERKAVDDWVAKRVERALTKAGRQ